MKTNIDYQEVFESISDPLAICDEDGRVMTMNSAAQTLLEPTGEVRLILTARETVRQMRMAPNQRHEFFMADVVLEGTRKKRVSVSLGSLEFGGYRVAFDPEPVRGVSANVRLLQSLVNAHRHTDLFVSPDRIAALFAACFQEVFTDVSFHLEFPDPGFVFQHQGWGSPALSRTLKGVQSGKLTADEFLWADSDTGYRVVSQDSEHPVVLQVERRGEEKFTVAEREALETFLQQTSLALGRILLREDYSKISPIIDHLDSVVLICDSRRKIRVTNKMFEDLVGTQAIGHDVLDFFDADSQKRLRTSSASVMASGEVAIFEGEVLRADKSSVRLQIQVAPIGVRESPGFVVTAGANQATVAQVSERLQRAEHLLNIGQLATGVAHELKNPLTSILNYADYLLQKYEGKFFEEKDRDRLQRIISGVEHIDSFVKDLLLLAKPDADTTEVVAISKLASDVVMSCEVSLERFGAHLAVEVESDAKVRGSRAQLKHVFVNLVNNAARAMEKPGGRIVLRARTEGKLTICEVVDDAKGIEPEHLERIFEPFFTTNDSEGGTGLGLAIVETIVRRHEGQIGVESTLGQGTTFRIIFPHPRV